MLVPDKFDRLRELLVDYARVAIAFSGGVDSSFLLKVALDTLGAGNVLVLFGQSILLTEEEILRAKSWLEHYGYYEGVEMVSVDAQPLNNKAFIQNSAQRCYLCKLRLFKLFREVMEKKGYSLLLDGTNTDDLKVNRPGLRAIHELGVKTPLVDAGLSKEEIRQLSKEMQLDSWNLPSASCLATRIPFGMEITRERLVQIAAWEEEVKKIGFSECRVRMVKDQLDTVYIQTAESDFILLANPNIRITVKRFFAGCGFLKVLFDLDGR